MSDMPSIFGRVFDRQAAADLDDQARKLRRQADRAYDETTRQGLLEHARELETQAGQLRDGR